MAHKDNLYFVDFEHGHVEYSGPDVKKFAQKLAVSLNCQVNVYRMDYSFSVRAPITEKGSSLEVQVKGNKKQ